MLGCTLRARVCPNSYTLYVSRVRVLSKYGDDSSEPHNTLSCLLRVPVARATKTITRETLLGAPLFSRRVAIQGRRVASFRAVPTARTSEAWSEGKAACALYAEGLRGVLGVRGEDALRGVGGHLRAALVELLS